MATVARRVVLFVVFALGGVAGLSLVNYEHLFPATSKPVEVLLVEVGLVLCAICAMAILVLFGQWFLLEHGTIPAVHAALREEVLPAFSVGMSGIATSLGEQTREGFRLIQAYTIGRVTSDVTASLASAETSISGRINARLGSVGLQELRTALLADVHDTFATLQLQTTAVAQRVEPGAPAAAEAGLPKLHSGAPTVIRWLARNEKKYKFFSLHFLHEKIFTEEAARQGLEFCITNGLVSLYDQPNPNNPRKPLTAACRLDRTNPLTLQILSL